MNVCTCIYIIIYAIPLIFVIVVVVVQVGECVINDLGTVVVVVVVVAVVVELYADIHNESFHTHALLGAYALECLSFNR